MMLASGLLSLAIIGDDAAMGELLAEIPPRDVRGVLLSVLLLVGQQPIEGLDTVEELRRHAARTGARLAEAEIARAVVRAARR